MIQDLSVGCGAYDRTWPLIAKTISVEGASLAWTILPPEEVFLRGMLGHEFDVTEMSFSSYLLQVCEISIHTINLNSWKLSQDYSGSESRKTPN